MACDATARLYDVDEDSVVFKKLQQTKKYDHGTVTFRARKGKLIDLDKLHESIWATRLSGGTRSGLVTLEVTAIGHIVTSQDKTVLKVAGSNAEFLLAQHKDKKHVAAFGKIQTLSNKGVVQVSGLIAKYGGRWPNLLRKKPEKPRQILVTDLSVPKIQ